MLILEVWDERSIYAIRYEAELADPGRLYIVLFSCSTGLISWLILSRCTLRYVQAQLTIHAEYIHRSETLYIHKYYYIWTIELIKKKRTHMEFFLKFGHILYTVIVKCATS